MKIGYLRVSTEEQKPDRQIDALSPICDELHIEKLSATAKKRPVYERIINSLQSGDVFVIWDLDRAFRSAKDALNELDNLRERGIEIQIASIHIDTSTPHGMLIYTFISGLAEFERRLLSERTKQGLAAARKRGQRLGPPPKMTDAQIRTAKLKIEAKRPVLPKWRHSMGCIHRRSHALYGGWKPQQRKEYHPNSINAKSVAFVRTI